MVKSKMRDFFTWTNNKVELIPTVSNILHSPQAVYLWLIKNNHEANAVDGIIVSDLFVFAGPD